MSLPPSELRTALREVRGIVRESVPLAPLTHLRIGGPAAFLVEPHTESDVARVVRICRELDVPLHVLGGGSNLVVSDQGVQGVVMSLAALNRVVRDGTNVSAGAGATLPSLIRNTRTAGLGGLEVLIGIPCVVGGAVAMNAGTRDGETFDRLRTLTVVTADGEPCTVKREDLSPRYRDGGLDGRIVLAAEFALCPEDPKQILARTGVSLRRRNQTQPVSEYSVGCVFKNPPGHSAGQLIEQAGLKTHRRGGVSVSGKHANYFVNDGTGTCSDFLQLMADVQARVQADTGLALDPECKFWGL